MNLEQIRQNSGDRRRGLMGSALVEHLHGEGYANVIALTRADCDLIDTSATFAAFERLRPDHVFHSAARVYGILGSLSTRARSSTTTS